MDFANDKERVAQAVALLKDLDLGQPIAMPKDRKESVVSDVQTALVHLQRALQQWDGREARFKVVISDLDHRVLGTAEAHDACEALGAAGRQAAERVSGAVRFKLVFTDRDASATETETFWTWGATVAEAAKAALLFYRQGRGAKEDETRRNHERPKQGTVA